jgi:hypothetical protein
VPIVRSPDPILPIELIALDIDGTLVGDELEIGPRTRAAVHAARRNGVVVSLVTGRMVSSALRFARELELDAPIVGYQGAIIRAMPAAGSKRLGRLFVHTPLRADVAERSFRGRGRSGSIRTSTISSGSSSGRTTRVPTTTARSWAPTRISPRTCSRRSVTASRRSWPRRAARAGRPPRLSP